MHRLACMIVIFTLAVSISACGGGSSSSSATSLSQVEGVYQLTSAEISAARTIDATDQGIYIFINGSYFALYGKDDSCFDVGSIVSESLESDGNISVTVALEKGDGSVMSCSEYLNNTLGVSLGRSSGGETHFEETTLRLMLWISQQTLSKIVFDSLLGIGQVTFNTMVFSLGTNVFETMVTLSFEEAHRLMVAAMVSMMSGATVDSGSGDQPSTGDTPSSSSGGSSSSAISDSCSGVTHGSGQSTITVCVKLDPPDSGVSVGFSMSGPSGYSSTSSGQSNSNGVACGTFTIYSYGSYSWSAGVSDGGASTSGSITVSSAEQTCGLE